MGTFSHAVNVSLTSKLPYDPHKDFAPVALIARSFNFVVVNANSPIRSIADLIQAAKADPDKLTYGTFGTGTSAHLAGELFKSMAKVSLTTVPYKGAAPAITDLPRGQLPRRSVRRPFRNYRRSRKPASPVMPRKAGTGCLRRPRHRPISSPAS